MILDHCVNLLTTGSSNIQPEVFDDMTKIMFKLESGVTAKKLDSVKTAMMMIELIKLRADDSSNKEVEVLFNNFVDYIYANFKEPTAMAIFRYAIKERKLNVKMVVKTRAWPRVADSFRPTMLQNSKAPKDVAIKAQYERCLARIKKCLAMSDAMNEYLRSHMTANTEFRALMA